MPYIAPTLIAAQIEQAIQFYGEDVAVLKYATAPAGGLYKQKTRAFEPPVLVRGLPQYGRQEDMITIIGDGAPFEGVITFGRNHLRAAFPNAVPSVYDAIREEDELGLRGKRWRVVKVHRSGPMNGEHMIVLVFFDFINARKEEAYP